MRYFITLFVLVLSASLAEANGSNVTFVTTGFGNRAVVTDDFGFNANFLVVPPAPVFFGPRVVFAAAAPPVFVGAPRAAVVFRGPLGVRRVRFIR